MLPKFLKAKHQELSLMTKKIIFQDSFLVSNIMCHKESGCGSTIHSYLSDLSEFKQQNRIPHDAQLVIDAKPKSMGLHCLFIMIESTEENFNLTDESKRIISEKFSESLDDINFKVIDKEKKDKHKINYVNWLNILVNISSMLTIIILTTLFTPSIPLTIGLISISYLTTAFTSRQYLINFLQNLRKKDFTNMTTTVSLGWLLSLAHTLYHAFLMPLAGSFSMIFMSFIMPIMLITIINGMDEIKRIVLNNSKKMHLQGMKNLFPQMSKEYTCLLLTEKNEEKLSRLMEIPSDRRAIISDDLASIQELWNDDKTVLLRKIFLRKGMIIKVNRGECFPVDCIIMQGNTIIDPALLTGEPQQGRKCLDSVPAGAINLGQTVTVYATENSYNSTVNKLLFRSNRAEENKTTEPNSKFTYFYIGLTVIGIAASIITPLALGALTFPLLLQNITGILFAVCPCTIAIGHQLPNLLSIYQRSNKGIILRNENLMGKSDPIHTVVFDKTGTLTTGNSQVDSYEGISDSLWQRIYLLEKNHGADHPMAKAINHYYETEFGQSSLIKDINEISTDRKNRGLSGRVQGKKIYIGNNQYLQQAGIILPPQFPKAVQDKILHGYSAVYVAEDNVYQGVILIKHEIRKNMLTQLNLLKKEGKELIMLTGDSQSSAKIFNQHSGGVFNQSNIKAEQTPQNKEESLEELMSKKGIDPKGVWFIGDGLNDGPCARIVTEKGGVSCAMTSDDKAAFFTDISLNDSLQYLFEHNRIQAFLKKNILQNQGILIYGIMAFLAFIITFSVMGIAVSPLIPLMIMVSTTLFTLFNSFRVKLAIDTIFDKKTSLLKQVLASDLSLGLLFTASSLLICGLLISIVATGGLTVPLIFTAGTALAVSSAFLLSAGIMFGVFILSGIGYLLESPVISNPEKPVLLKNTITLPENQESLTIKAGSNSEHYVSPYRKIVEEIKSVESGNASYIPV